MAKQLPVSRETTEEEIISRIYLIRGQKVMLDRDLAEMYGVETFNLNKAVKRNIQRFPEKFMFQLNRDEFKSLTFQNGISSWGGTRKLPYAFTEHGVLSLAFVLRSDRAIQVSSRIIDVYIKMRELLMESKDLWRRVENIEHRLDKKDDEVQAIFAAFKAFMKQEQKPRNKIGFTLPAKKK